MSFVARWVDDLYVATAFYRRQCETLEETRAQVVEYEHRIRKIYEDEGFGMKSEDADIFCWYECTQPGPSEHFPSQFDISFANPLEVWHRQRAYAVSTSRNKIALNTPETTMHTV